MDKFYNQTEKLEYISKFDNEDIKSIIALMFVKSRSTEKFYNQDLYSFNLKQIELVIKNINPATMNSMKNTKSRIKKYIDWAIEQGRRMNNINPINGTSTEWEQKFIDSNSKRYLSSEDVHDIVDDLENAQDKALIQCIFEGVSGRSMSELISMRYNDINWMTNTVTVRDSKDDVTRKVKVSSRCLNLINEAYNQEYYISEKTYNEKELIHHEEFIFKKTRWKNTKNVQVNRFNLAKRLYIIKEKYQLESLSVQSINESGRIKMAYDLLVKNDKNTLEKADFKEIGDQFKLPKMNIREYSYYDTTKMKNYINPENLEKLYSLQLNP